MTLLAVLLESLFGRLALGMVSFAFPLFALSLGLSLAEIGVLLSLRSVALLAVRPITGQLADRFGARAVFAAGAALRTGAAALLLLSGDFVSLAGVRILQGASAAGGDSASLGLVARHRGAPAGSASGWHASAQHVGAFGGAALAGITLTATASYGQVFLIVLGVSLVSLAAAWPAVRRLPRLAPPRSDDPPLPLRDLIRELSGPASAGLLLAAAAYMVHGFFPILATEHAGLSAGQAGIIYSASGIIFVLASPAADRLIGRWGQGVGVAWRTLANAASSIAYAAFPSYAGLAAARLVDDSGQAASRPAWAAAVGEIARRDPPRARRRLAALDASENAGEALGPLLAGVLWQAGGVLLLVVGRIVVALAAEVAAVRTLGERDGLERVRDGIGRRLATPTGVLLAHLGPVGVAAAAASAWLGIFSEWGRAPILVADLAVATGILALGILCGALAGRAALDRRQRHHTEGWQRRLDRLGHDLRAPLTVIRGEVELVLGDESRPEERRRSAEVVVREVDRATEVVTRATSPPVAPIDAGAGRARAADQEPRRVRGRLTRTDEAMDADDAADGAGVIGLRGRKPGAGRGAAGGPASGDPGVA